MAGVLGDNAEFVLETQLVAVEKTGPLDSPGKVIRHD